MIEKILSVVDYGSSIFFIIWSMVMFYLSLKKCFLQEGKSKVKLFILSLITSPYLTLLGTVVVVTIASFLIPGVLEEVAELQTIFNRTYITIIIVVSFFYLIIMILFSVLLGKWLKTSATSAILFIYLMFSTITVLSNRSSGTGMLFSIPYLREIVDILGICMLGFAIWFLYRYVIVPLSEMKNELEKIDWRAFIIPPAIFHFIYIIFSNLSMTADNSADDKMVTIIYVFSSVIVGLFLWAYYVIIKNIKATNEVKHLSVEVMEALAHTIDAKDEYTRGHSVRVAKYSRMLAEKMGLTPKDCENVYYMGLLHDIGKIGVPNEIINSKNKLSDTEYSVIKTHPGIGYDILAEIKSRPDLCIGARWHHERYDGKGYPDGKGGEDIPLYARIIAVADSYDAMTSNRSYRNYMSQEKVRSEIENNMGTQFDPEVAKCMLGIIDNDVNYEMHE